MESLIYTLYDSIAYSFIYFNYTYALDRCDEITEKLIPTDFGNHKANNTMIYTHSFGCYTYLQYNTRRTYNWDK